MTRPHLTEHSLQPSPSQENWENGVAKRVGLDLGYAEQPISREPIYTPPTGKDQIARFLDILFRRKWTIILGSLFCVAVATVYTYSVTPEYQATSYVTVDLGDISLEISEVSQMASEDNTNLSLFTRSDRTLRNEIRLLQISDHLFSRVDNSLRENPPAGPDSYKRHARGQVSFEEEIGSDNILKINGKSSSAKEAALLANTYATEYVAMTRQASRSQLVTIRDALSSSEKTYLSDLKYVEGQITKYKQRGVSNLDAETARLVESIAGTDIERETARINLQVAQAALQSLQSELDQANPQIAQRISSGIDRRMEILQGQLEEDEALRNQIILDNPTLSSSDKAAINMLDGRITEVKSEMDSLSLQMLNDAALMGGITDSDEGIQYLKDLNDQITVTRQEVNRLEVTVQALDDRMKRYQRDMQQLPQQSMELAQLERERVRAELRYQNTLDQLQEAELALNADAGYAQVIGEARVPFRPLNPNIPVNLGLGVFFGLFFGLVIAVAQEQVDNKVYQPEQLREKRLREIGVIPSMKSVLKKNFKNQQTTKYEGLQMSTSLIPLLEPVSLIADAYRSVRTNLHYGFRGEIFQTLAVTSPGMGEGKSTTAANIAIVMAQSGRKTLLLDADLRRPKVHRLFGVPQGGGIVENIFGVVDFDPDSWSTPIPNLSILTTGNLRLKAGSATLVNPELQAFMANPSELLGSKQMHMLLEALRGIFDMIVVDTSPLLLTTEASIMATQSDMTLMVVRSGKTKEGDLDRAFESMETVGVSNYALVLNDFNINNAFGHAFKYRTYSKSYGAYGYSHLNNQ